jgi:uncharacterized protein (TIRG00374 family)
LKKKKWGRILSIGFILLSMLVVVLIAFNNPELMNAWDVLFTLDKRWLLLCLLAMVGYVYAEGAGLCTFLRMEGYKVSLNTATHFSFAGIYYANVTPGSSGGQPMQIYLMSQRSIPAGVATSALTARYFFNQLTLVVMTLLLWLSNRVYVAEHLGNVIPLIILGCVVNSFCVPSILLVTFHRSWVEKIVQWGIRFLTKIHICKKPEQWQASAETTIEHFHGSLMDLVHHPMHLLAQLVISVVEMSCLMVVPLLVYRAMDLTGTPWYHVLTVSFLLFVSASYTPLPGASGAQEGGFLVYFASVFTGGTVSVALLVWRFITYYLCLLVGCADSIFTSLRKRVKPIRHEKKGQTKEQS